MNESSVGGDLPDTPLALDALGLARRHEHPAIANHSIRTYLHARLAAPTLGLREGSDFDGEELFVACILHDIGTSAAYDGPQRFEVEGADAAARFLAENGAATDVVGRVWEAIALHTSSGIAERLGPLTRLTRAGVLSDFDRPSLASADLRAAFEAEHPRLDVERELGCAVVAQALANPAKAPRSTWPGGLYRAHLADPAATGVNPAF